MTSNGSRARDYRVCCGASTTWDLRSWIERKEFSSGASGITPRKTLEWNEDKKRGRCMNETWQKHKKSSPNQTVASILIRPVRTAELETGFPTLTSPCLIQTLLMPLSLRAWKIPASWAHSLWNSLFLFHISLLALAQISCLFTGKPVSNYKAGVLLFVLLWFGLVLPAFWYLSWVNSYYEGKKYKWENKIKKSINWSTFSAFQ